MPRPQRLALKHRLAGRAAFRPPVGARHPVNGTLIAPRTPSVNRDETLLARVPLRPALEHRPLPIQSSHLHRGFIRSSRKQSVVTFPPSPLNLPPTEARPHD